MNMTTSAPGRELIELFEGCEQASQGGFIAYHDSVGVLTQGYGHTNLGNIAPTVTTGTIWTQVQCDTALSNDLAKFEVYVMQAMVGFNMMQYQFDALVSFDFNTGDLARSSIPRRLKTGDIGGAMAVLLEYNHAAGGVLSGLTRRRHAERLMFLDQVDAALVLAGAHANTINAAMSKAAQGNSSEPPLAG
jgi:lysozyme